MMVRMQTSVPYIKAGSDILSQERIRRPRLRANRRNVETVVTA